MKNDKKYHLANLDSLIKNSISITSFPNSTEEKASRVNKLIKKETSQYINLLKETISAEEKLVIAYCSVVLSIQYRHQIRAYEYMDFSRRIGELWQEFCATAWNFSPLAHIKKYDPPKFENIKVELIDKLKENLDIENLNRVISLSTLIPEINLKEDVTYTNNGNLKVIDFKSGFGSNEKGNTHRLLTVANAYKFIDPKVSCYLLVRQTENNHYLQVLANSGLWDVRLGREAYKFMANETGVDILSVSEICSDILNDIIPTVVNDLKKKVSGIEKYTKWGY